MTVLKMSKNQKCDDKFKLIKEEEEAIPESHCETEASNCETRCRRILCYAVLSGMLILSYCCILLGWQSYMKHLQSNETEPIFYIYGTPIFHIKDSTEDIDTNTLDKTGNIHSNFYRRKRSTQTVIGLQSQDHDNSNKRDENYLREAKNSPNVEDNFSSKHYFLNENSDSPVNLLEKMIETEQMKSKTKNSFGNKEEEKKERVDMKMDVASHITTEEEEKHFINTNIPSQNKDIGSKIAEIEISKITNLEIDHNFKSTIRKIIRNDDPLSLINKIYWCILLACGVLLLIAFGLCGLFVYKKCGRKMYKHRKLEEDKEIYNRRNPLSLSGTPIQKDLRFKKNIEKFDLFCDLYE